MSKDLKKRTNASVAIDANKTLPSQAPLYPSETYRQKTRNLLHLRKSMSIHAPPQTTPTLTKATLSLQLKPLCYQAQYAALSQTRQDALEGLVMLDRFAQETLTCLETALQDPDVEVRTKALALLATYEGELPKSLMERLIDAAWDPELEVRRAAAYTLQFHPDPRALGRLMGLLGTKDETLREIAIASLNEISRRLGPPPPATDGDT